MPHASRHGMPLPSPDGDLHPGGCFFCGLVGYWPTVHGELYHLAKVLVFYFEFSRIVANGVPSHSVSSSNSKWAQPTCSLFVIVFSLSRQGLVVDDGYVSFVSSWNILPFILECADLQANLLRSMSWQLWGECRTYTPLLVPTRVWCIINFQGNYVWMKGQGNHPLSFSMSQCTITSSWIP